MALAKAIERETGRRADGDGAERAFLLAELALELSRVHPQTAPGYLPVEEVSGAIGGLVVELKAMTADSAASAPSGIQKYVKRAFREALR